MNKAWPTKKLEETIKITDMIEKKIKRGKESWAFTHFIFEALLAFILFPIGVLPIFWCYKIFIFLILVIILTYLSLFNAWF